GGILEIDRDDHLVGNIARARIVLSEQIGKNFVHWKFEILEAPALGAGELAATHHQHDGLDEAALAVDAEDVLVDAPVMEDGLALDGFFDRADAVANARGLLEFEARRVILHEVAHLAEQLEIFSLEQHLGRVQMAAVLLAVDGQTARPEASLDLIFEARARAIAEHGVGAGAQRKDLADDVDGLAQTVGRAERAEVAAAVLDDLAGDGDARPRVTGDLGAQVGFVVFEADVVPGLVLLDEVVFEDQRFFLACGDDGVEVAHAAHQETHLVAAVAALAEVGAHARAERFRLADVEHFAGAVEQEIDAGI